MAAIVYKTFKGEIPREEPHLLPDMYAQLAENCDFVRGSLSPMKDGSPLQSMASSPVKAIFTKDGINFYTWSQETHAFNSPIIDDEYNRMYYLTPGDGVFRASTTLQMSYNGGSPTQSWRAGVPKPTEAPELSLVDRSSFPDYPSVTAECVAYWDLNGKTYGQVEAAVTVIDALREYKIPVPEIPEDTPDGVVLVVNFKFMDADNDKAIATFNIRASSSARSTSIPGTAEASLTVDGNEAKIRIEYGPREARAYTYTYENTWEEESAPAPPATISPTYVQDVKIVTKTESFSGFRPLKETNIYRTYGTSETYVKTEVIDNDDHFIDNSVVPTSVGRALDSIDYYPSPTGLQGAVGLPNGWFAAFKGNTLYMSEPYRPHAWPYSMTFPNNIRGLCPAQQSLVVTATDGVYIVAGSYPRSAQQVKLACPQPGIAQRSMANIDGAVAYASNDNIILVSGNSATPEAGQKLFTRNKWRERYSASLSSAGMRFGYHDGALVMTSKDQNLGFVIRLDEAVGSFTRTTVGFDSMFLLPVTDTLYYSIGSTVYRYNSGAAKQFDWWGKDFVFTKQETFGAGYIRCDGAVTVRLYADGEEVFSATLATGHFRLPGITPKLRWSVRITGNVSVHELHLARSMMELQRI